MYAKFSKCEFWLGRVTFPGHVVSFDGISIDPIKVKAIMEKLRPRSVKKVQDLLGLAGYYLQFIKGFSKLA